MSVGWPKSTAQISKRLRIIPGPTTSTTTVVVQQYERKHVAAVPVWVRYDNCDMKMS